MSRSIAQMASDLEIAMGRCPGLETIAGELHRWGLYKSLFELIDEAKLAAAGTAGDVPGQHEEA